MSNPLHSYKMIQQEHKATLAHCFETTPIKVGAIAEKLGITIKVQELKNFAAGVIKKNEGYTLHVNRDSMREYQRFTISLLVGYFLLYKDKLDASPQGIELKIRPIRYYDSEHADIEDFTCFRVALDLLMPHDLTLTEMGIIEDEMEKNGVSMQNADYYHEVLVEKLACKFQVPIYIVEAKINAMAKDQHNPWLQRWKAC